jgi:hypothetical protein
VDQDREPVKLAVGSMVDAWNTVSTNEYCKLFLKRETGVLNSIGGSSTIFLDSRETDRGPVDSIEMTEGLLRVTKQSGRADGTAAQVSQDLGGGVRGEKTDSQRSHSHRPFGAFSAKT